MGRLAVLSTVNLNDEPLGGKEKVHNVALDDDLALDGDAEFFGADSLPETSLRGGGIVTHEVCATLESVLAGI